MGYLRNECIVVSSWSEDNARKAHATAVKIFTDHDMHLIVGALTPHAMNGGAAFLIAPDGPKEGWEHSNIAERARGEFIAYLKGAAGIYVDWVLLLIGGDDGEYGVLDSPNGAQKAAVP